MSFEGYYQELCLYGHLNLGRNAFDSPEPCFVCAAPIVWKHLVDDTNLDGYGLITDRDWNRVFRVDDPNLEYASPTYKRPTEAETKHYSTHYDSFYRRTIYTYRKPVEFATDDKEDEK